MSKLTIPIARVFFSDIGWCKLEDDYNGRVRVSLDDRHDCSFPVGNINEVRKLRKALQEVEKIIDDIESEQDDNDRHNN